MRPFVVLEGDLGERKAHKAGEDPSEVVPVSLPWLSRILILRWQNQNLFHRRTAL